MIEMPLQVKNQKSPEKPRSKYSPKGLHSPKFPLKRTKSSMFGVTLKKIEEWLGKLELQRKISDALLGQQSAKELAETHNKRIDRP